MHLDYSEWMLFSIAFVLASSSSEEQEKYEKNQNENICIQRYSNQQLRRRTVSYPSALHHSPNQEKEETHKTCVCETQMRLVATRPNLLF